MLTNIFSNSKTKTFTIPANQQVKGDVESSIAVVICGSVHGDVVTTCDVFIKAGGTVFGKISSANAVVEGKVTGMITCKERVTALAGSIVEGEIAAAEVNIEPGAVFIERKEQTMRNEPFVTKAGIKKDETIQKSAARAEIKADEKFTGVVDYMPPRVLAVQRWF